MTSSGASLFKKEENVTHLKKTTLIQFGMECVRGPLKFQLMMTTVTRMETVFMMKVNKRYLRMIFEVTIIYIHLWHAMEETREGRQRGREMFRFSHLAISGSTSDVGGRIFDTRSRKTTSESKMLMPRVTYDDT